MRFNSGKAYLAVAFFLAGSSVVSVRYLSGSLAPFTTTFFSLVFAVATGALCYGRRTWDALRTIRRSQWKILILQAIFGIFLFRVCLAVGLRYTSAVEAGIITGASPALTAVFTWLLLREAIRAKDVAGILLTLAGILLLQGFPFNLAAFDMGHLLGNALALCAAACEALYTTLSRKMHLEAGEAQPLPPFAQAGIVSGIALLFCLVPMLLERPGETLRALPPGGWLALAWYGCFVTMGASALMFAGAKRCDGYTIAAFAGILPISSLLLAVVLLGEGVAVYQLLGCGCILAGILVMSKKERTGGAGPLST